MTNIHAYISPDQFAALQEHTNATQLNLALGYLCTWNFSLPIVEITVASDGSNGDEAEIIAVYRREAGKEPVYVIAAVWDGNTFGFHS